MKRKLGKDYDQEYAALNKEEVLMKRNSASKTQDQDDEFFRKMLVESMPDEIKNLDFTMPGMKTNLGPKVSKRLQLWLCRQVSHCPVLRKSGRILEYAIGHVTSTLDDAQKMFIPVGDEMPHINHQGRECAAMALSG